MSGEREYFYIGDRNKSTSGIKSISGIWKTILPQHLRRSTCSLRVSNPWRLWATRKRVSSVPSWSIMQTSCSLSAQSIPTKTNMTEASFVNETGRHTVSTNLSRRSKRDPSINPYACDLNRERQVFLKQSNCREVKPFPGEPATSR